jgi:hypothetical protein
LRVLEFNVVAAFAPFQNVIVAEADPPLTAVTNPSVPNAVEVGTPAYVIAHESPTEKPEAVNEITVLVVEVVF